MSPLSPSLRLGRPLWLDRDVSPPMYPRLSGSHDASVVIVGGGITGALVANLFASAGVSTVLLEASRVGRGSTAASSALLLQEPDLKLSELTKRYGARRSHRMWEMSHESVDQLVALLRRLRVKCDLEPRDAIYYASDAEALSRLEREYELRQRAGFAATWLGPGDIRRMTGLTGRGAIRTRGSAQFDPYRACTGVMRAAAASGARIFEQSAVRRIAADKDRVRVVTNRGVVEADRVIIATGYATAQFRPLAGRFRMYRTYVLVTEPVSADDRRELGLSDVLVWDTGQPYHYARWTAGHRLLVGGGDRVVRPGARRRQQFAAAIDRLRTDFEARLPALSAIETQFAWEGLFAMTPDTLPYVGPHRQYPGHWFALGYGGNGMTFAFLAARLLLERWQRRTSPDHALFEFGRTRTA